MERVVCLIAVVLELLYLSDMYYKYRKRKFIHDCRPLTR